MVGEFVDGAVSRHVGRLVRVMLDVVNELLQAFRALKTRKRKNRLKEYADFFLFFSFFQIYF